MYVVVNDDMAVGLHWSYVDDCSAYSCSLSAALQSLEQTKRTSYAVGRHQSDVLPREHNSLSNEVVHSATSPGILAHSSRPEMMWEDRDKYKMYSCLPGT